MKNLLMVIALAFILVGCDSSGERTNNYELPQGLSDCHIFRVSPDGIGKTLYVVRCPNSTTSTTYNSGKSDTSSVTYIGE